MSVCFHTAHRLGLRIFPWHLSTFGALQIISEKLFSSFTSVASKFWEAPIEFCYKVSTNGFASVFT